MLEAIHIQCPFCFEQVLLCLAPDERGEMITDCEVCCRPWLLRVWEEEGEMRCSVERS